MRWALLLALLLMGCATVPRMTVRNCIMGGEPSTVEDWKALTMECTSNEGDK